MTSNSLVLIIQARYGSARFRGKIMANLCGEPLISRILQRVKKVKKIKKIIIATTKKKEDDVLLKIAKIHKVEIFRGSENDLVDRYYNSIKKMKLKNILRLPADNSVPEPSEYNRIINYHLKSNNDFSSNLINFMGNGYPDGIGVEIFKVESLKKIWKFEKRKRYREHLALNFYDCATPPPKIYPSTGKKVKKKFNFKVGTVKCPKHISRPDLIFDINNYKNYTYIRQLYKYFYPKIYFTIKEIIKWHDQVYLKSDNK